MIAIDTMSETHPIVVADTNLLLIAYCRRFLAGMGQVSGRPLFIVERVRQEMTRQMPHAGENSGFYF